MNFRKMIEEYANDPYITCDDIEKCGQCLREHLRSNVSREYLISNTMREFTSTDLANVEAETKYRFKATSLYKRVKSLLNEGKDIKDIDEDLKKEGIEI